MIDGRTAPRHRCSPAVIVFTPPPLVFPPAEEYSRFTSRARTQPIDGWAPSLARRSPQRTPVNCGVPPVGGGVGCGDLVAGVAAFSPKSTCSTLILSNSLTLRPEHHRTAIKARSRGAAGLGQSGEELVGGEGLVRFLGHCGPRDALPRGLNVLLGVGPAEECPSGPAHGSAGALRSRPRQSTSSRRQGPGHRAVTAGGAVHSRSCGRDRPGRPSPVRLSPADRPSYLIPSPIEVEAEGYVLIRPGGRRQTRRYDPSPQLAWQAARGYSSVG